MLIFGMGFSAAQQLRVAATDMYPPRLRAMALGFVAAGAMLGLVIAPVLMWLSEIDRRALRPRADRAAVADGADAAAHRHGAGDVRAARSEGDRDASRALLSRLHAAAEARASPTRPTTSASACCLRHTPTRLAIISNCAGQGNMSIVMVLTSLVLAHHGHSLTAIALLAHVPLRRHVRLHGADRPAGGPHRPRAGDVSGRRDDAGRRDLRHVRLGVLVGDGRHVSGRARLGGRQCRVDRADRRPDRDRRTAAAPSA